MSAAPAAALGIDLVLLAQSATDSGAQVAAFEVGDYRDLVQVREFAKKCDLLTFEHELIPISVIRALENEGVKFYPTSESFIYSQDKAAMREKLANYLAPKWQVVTKASEILEFPVIAKSISGGYDGRGVWKVNSEGELAAILLENPKLLVEELIDFDFEISVMVARSPHGQAATWAPTQTVQSDGICTMTIAPAPDLSEALGQQAQQIALSIAAEIKLVGVMAVEMFVKGEQLFINELAMRPHNSGHWTIDGSVTSQFEQHLRAILDLPLGDTSMSAKYAVMGNVLGGDKQDMYRPYLHLLARTPKLKVHQYRKEVKPGRKIGHVTLLGENLVELITEVQHAIDYMGGVIDE
jgi:5-(carboxyamino)imidazole ribonucleotide synthase